MKGAALPRSSHHLLSKGGPQKNQLSKGCINGFAALLTLFFCVLGGLTDDEVDNLC
jgi:hypothetical protein